MIYVRGTHPYHFRSGQWAHLFSIQHDTEGRDIWCVEFPDGVQDAWPSWDTAAWWEVKIQMEEPDDSWETFEDRLTPISIGK